MKLPARSSPVFASLAIVAALFAGCAKRSSRVLDNGAESVADKSSSSTEPTQAVVHVAGNDLAPNDDTPLALPSLGGAGPYQGPPFKPPRRTAHSVDAGEPIGPAATSGVASTPSSTDSDAPSSAELLESDPGANATPLTEPIDPARLFRRREDWTAAETAADALGRIGAPSTAEIVPMLDDSDPSTRRRGAEILAQIGSAAESAVPVLIRLVEQDSDPQVRNAAAFALGQMGPKAAAAIPALKRMLSEDAP